MILNLLRDWRPYGISALLIAATSTAVFLKEDMYTSSTIVQVEKGALSNTESLNESFVLSTIQKIFRDSEIKPISDETNLPKDYIKDMVDIHINRAGEAWNPTDIYSVTVNATFSDGEISTWVANTFAEKFRDEANSLSGYMREETYRSLTSMEKDLEKNIWQAEKELLSLKTSSTKGVDTSMEIAKYERILGKLNDQHNSVLTLLNNAQFEIEVSNNDNFEILEFATGQGELQGMSKLKMYITALFASIVSGFGLWAYKLENDDTIRKAGDMEKLSGITPFISIPKLNS